MPEDALAVFRAELRTRSAKEIVREHVIAGTCRSLDDASYRDLKEKVAEQFDVHPNEVIVVGSAKLGFSIAPLKRYRAFSDASDIDVVLCSPGLFDRIWQAVFDYHRRGETWDGLSDFRKYLFRGWMRPDKMPPEPSFALSSDWWEFFRKLTASGAYGPYKISGALYKSWHFLESYQNDCVGQCQSAETEVR
jgi:hypothetical protein